MSPDRGGILDTLLRLVRFGLGGTSASGMQFVSWIHDADFLGSIDYLIARDEIGGVVNIASPNPLRNREFMKALREAWGSRIELPAASWMLEIGTFFLRSETDWRSRAAALFPVALSKLVSNFNSLGGKAPHNIWLGAGVRPISVKRGSLIRLAITCSLYNTPSV